MATWTDIPDSIVAPNQTLTDEDLDALLVTNAEAADLAIYGSRRPDMTVGQHDHGAHGGVLLTRQIESLTLGPHAEESSGDDPVAGLPLWAPSTGVDFTDEPKRMASALVYLPAGVESLFVSLTADLPGAGTRTATIQVELRPLLDIGLLPGEGAGQVEAAGLSSATATTRVADEVEFDALGEAGNTGRGRVAELVLWLASNSPAASSYRLLDALLYHDGTGDALFAAVPGLARVSIASVEIRPGRVLSASLFSRARRLFNQLSYALLGFIPGFSQATPTLPDVDEEWEYEAEGEHGHRGISEKDGAVVRSVLWAQSYVENLGDDTSAQEMDGAGHLGQRIHSGGALTEVGGWKPFSGRGSIPKGLGAFEIYFTLLPGHALTSARLTLYVRVRPITGQAISTSSIATSLRSGQHVSAEDQSTLEVGIDGFHTVRVDPLPGGPIWRPTPTPLWSEAELLPTVLLPDGASRSHPYRAGTPVRVEITPTDTVDCQIELRFALETGDEGSGTYEADARVQSILVLTADGF